ncbi:MAG: Inhibition of morphological differentiation protein [actinobacterium acAMD-2]|jgi:HAD superfamily hydrolase (TIGR01490 family)|nr:MAG: Inhibition of morphological differentiation protein [actinobacterium acAMD-2]
MLCRVSTASSPTPQPARTGARSQTKRPAAFFDLDKTVIAKSSALVFSRPLYRSGLINRRDVLRSAYAQFVYVLGGADHDQMERMREYLSALTEGWDADQLREIVAEALQEAVEPIIYEEAANLIDEHHAAGRDVVIVSSSGQEIVELIGAMLGADHSIGTRVAIVDGQYTGQIEFYAYAENKAQAMRDLADEQGYDLSQSYAYSDAATDLPMLESVGFPSVVNPDRPLRREAMARDWPILTFSKPVPLRQRFASGITAKPTLTAVALGGAAAAAGLIWYAVRRRGSTTD